MNQTKKTVGVTMRLDKTEQGEWRAAIDQTWVTLLEEGGFNVVLLPISSASPQSIFDENKLEALLLTGGNDVMPEGKSYSEQRSRFELGLLKESAARKIPVAGVCRGIQMMNIYSGGTSTPVEGHVAKPHIVTWNEQSLTVNSFHDFGITQDTLGSDLIATALDEAGGVEAVRHKSLPWQGVMWHPERAIDNQRLHLDWLRSVLNGTAQ